MKRKKNLFGFILGMESVEVCSTILVVNGELGEIDGKIARAAGMGWRRICSIGMILVERLLGCARLIYPGRDLVWLRLLGVSSDITDEITPTGELGLADDWLLFGRVRVVHDEEVSVDLFFVVNKGGIGEEVLIILAGEFWLEFAWTIFRVEGSKTTRVVPDGRKTGSGIGVFRGNFHWHCAGMNPSNASCWTTTSMLLFSTKLIVLIR